MMANRTNPDNGLCFPSHERLASDCGMSKRSVIQQITKLEKAGFIQVIRSKNSNNVKVVNRYKLNIVDSASSSLPQCKPCTTLVNEMHYPSERDALGGSERDAHETESFLNKKETQTTNSVVVEKIEKAKAKSPDEILAQITDPLAIQYAKKQLAKTKPSNPIAYATSMVNLALLGDLIVPTHGHAKAGESTQIPENRIEQIKAFINKNKQRLLNDENLKTNRFINVSVLGVITTDDFKQAGLYN